MSGSVVRILAVLALVFAAPGAMAQSTGYVTEYRWLTLFGEASYALPAPEGRAGSQPRVFESLLRRAFLTLETEGRLTGPVAADRHFRGPDPEFGQPEAFRRKEQARLSFSLRF